MTIYKAPYTAGVTTRVHSNVQDMLQPLMPVVCQNCGTF